MSGPEFSTFAFPGRLISGIRYISNLYREPYNNKIFIKVRCDGLEMYVIQWLKLGFRYFNIFFVSFALFISFLKNLIN